MDRFCNILIILRAFFSPSPVPINFIADDSIRLIISMRAKNKIKIKFSRTKNRIQLFLMCNFYSFVKCNPYSSECMKNVCQDVSFIIHICMYSIECSVNILRSRDSLSLHMARERYVHVFIFMDVNVDGWNSYGTKCNFECDRS